MLKAT